MLSVQIFKTLLEEGQIIVSSNTNSRPNKSVSHSFPQSWNSFHIYGVISNYQNPITFLYKFNSAWEMIHCFCFGPNKYGCLSFWTLQKVSSLWYGVYASPNEILKDYYPGSPFSLWFTWRFYWHGEWLSLLLVLFFTIVCLARKNYERIWLT